MSEMQHHCNNLNHLLQLRLKCLVLGFEVTHSTPPFSSSGSSSSEITSSLGFFYQSGSSASSEAEHNLEPVFPAPALKNWG